MMQLNLRPLPGILARFVGIGKRRPYEFAVDTIWRWARRGYDPNEAPIFTEVGPVHITLGAHERMRAFCLQRHIGRGPWKIAPVKWHGFFYRRDRNSWTVTAIFFCFTLTFMWAASVNVEKVEPFQFGQRSP